MGRGLLGGGFLRRRLFFFYVGRTLRNHVFHERNGVAALGGSNRKFFQRHLGRDGFGGNVGAVVKFEFKIVRGGEPQAAEFVRGKTFGRIKRRREAFPAVHHRELEEFFKDLHDDFVTLFGGKKEPIGGRHRRHVFKVFGELIGVGFKFVEKLDFFVRKIAVVVGDRGFVDAVDLVGEFVKFLGEDVLRRAHESHGGRQQVGVRSHGFREFLRFLLPPLLETAFQGIPEGAGFKVLDGETAVGRHEINRVLSLFCHLVQSLENGALNREGRLSTAAPF